MRFIEGFFKHCALSGMYFYFDLQLLSGSTVKMMDAPRTKKLAKQVQKYQKVFFDIHMSDKLFH